MTALLTRQPAAVRLGARWRASWAGLARRHWLALLLLAARLVLRVLVQFAYRPALFYIDTSRYLYDAQGMDPAGDKGPLRAILLVANFGAVAAVQHLLGLAMAVVIYLLLVRRGVARWLAALAIAPVLLDAYQLQGEQAIMPGTWFEALIVAAGHPALAARTRLAGSRGGRPGARHVGHVRPGRRGPDPPRGDLPAGRRRRLAAGPRPGGGLLRRIRPADPGLLHRLLPGRRGLLPLPHRRHLVLRAGRRRGGLRDAPAPGLRAGHVPGPGPAGQGADWLEYQPGSPIRPYYANLPRTETDSLISDFNHRVLAQQPQRLLGAYGRDLAKLFALTRATSPGDTPISRWQFQTAYPYFSSHSTRPEVAAEIAEFGGGAPALWRPVAGFLRSYQLDGGYTPGPLLALCVVTGLAGSAVLVRRRWRADPAARLPALAAVAFFASGAFVLLASDLFEFSWRYQLPALVTLVPAGALGIAALKQAVSGPR